MDNPKTTHAPGETWVEEITLGNKTTKIFCGKFRYPQPPPDFSKFEIDPETGLPIFPDVNIAGMLFENEAGNWQFRLLDPQTLQEIK